MISDWLIEWATKNGYGLYLSLISAILLPLFLYFGLRLSDKRSEEDVDIAESLKLETDIDKLNQLSKKVEVVSKELDQTFTSIADDLSKRRVMINNLQNRIKELLEQEKELQDSVNVLQNTSVKSAKYFTHAVKNIYSEVDKKSSKKATKRATLFFFLGILSSIVIDIVKGIFFK